MEWIASPARPTDVRANSRTQRKGAPVSLPTTPTWQIAPWIHLPRLEAVTGCRLTDLDWTTLEGLISNEIREDLSLDYKAVLYAADDKGRFELGKDVAAFANASGGLIIIGIGESKHIPSGFSRIQPTDSDRRTLITTLADRVAPFVPDIEIGLVGSPRGDAGCLLVLVPSSDQAPHAVLSKPEAGPNVADALSYPVREGTQTRWLREAELSSRYRQRFAARVDVVSRSEALFRDGIGGVDRAETLWLAVGLAASKPTANRSLSADVRDEVQGNLMKGAGYPHYQFSSQPSFGRSRVVLSDRYGQKPLSHDHHVELHTDGGAFAAVALHAEVPREVADGRMALPPGRVTAASSPQISIWLISLLDLCARHAVLFGAAGDFHVVAQLLSPLGGDEFGLELAVSTPNERRSDPVVLTEPYGVGGGAVRLVPGSMALTETTEVTATTTASVGNSPRELVALCAHLGNEIFAEFGQLPSDWLLGLSGLVSDVASRGHGLATLRGWAEEKGLLNPIS